MERYGHIKQPQSSTKKLLYQLGYQGRGKNVETKIYLFIQQVATDVLICFRHGSTEFVAIHNSTKSNLENYILYKPFCQLPHP